MTTPSPKQKLHHRLAHHAKHWFIPHAGNDHRPHALRPRALRTYAYILITAKIASAIFLFVAFPNQAQYAAYTSKTLLTFTNASRTENGAGALQANSLLTEAATRKAKDMLARNYFAHTTPDGKRFWTWIDAVGYDYTLAGENLAVDFVSPEAAHAALMASPTHRANLLNTRYKDAGIAVVTGKMGDSETTVLVELFATPVAKKTVAAKVVTTKPKTTIPKPTAPKPVPAPKPQVQAAETPKPKGKLAQQSVDRVTLITGTAVDVWAEFQNLGEQTWKASEVQLVTADPTRRASSFADNSWTSPSVVAALEQDVSPQEVLRVEWKLSAALTPGEQTENFTLVDAAGALIAGTTVAFATNVTASTAVVTSEPTQTDLTQPAPTGTPPEPAPQISQANQAGIVGLVANFGNRFFLAFLFFLMLAFLINIFVKVRIQHAHVIGQSLAVIALAAGALFFKFHFLERITPIVRVLGLDL